MPNFAYSKHTRRLDETGEVVAELDEAQFQDLIQQHFFLKFNSVLAGEKENLAKTELKFLKFSVAVWGPTTTTRLCNLRRTVPVHTVQNGWGVQKSSAASRAEIQFAQHPLTRSAQKFTVAMTSKSHYCSSNRIPIGTFPQNVAMDIRIRLAGVNHSLAAWHPLFFFFLLSKLALLLALPTVIAPTLAESDRHANADENRYLDLDIPPSTRDRSASTTACRVAWFCTPVLFPCVALRPLGLGLTRSQMSGPDASMRWSQ